MRWRQLRLLRRIIPTSRNLFLFKICDSSVCTFRRHQDDSISHLFWSCQATQKFWTNLAGLLMDICPHHNGWTFSDIPLSLCLCLSRPPPPPHTHMPPTQKCGSVWFLRSDRMVSAVRSCGFCGQIVWFLRSDRVVSEVRSCGFRGQIVWFLRSERVVSAVRSYGF